MKDSLMAQPRLVADPQPAQDQLRQDLEHFICQVVLPGPVTKLVREQVGARLDPAVLERALASAREKVGLIMAHIPQLNSQALFLRIPDQDFLTFLLLSEYILANSLAGEQGALRYVKKTPEPQEETLAFCLHVLGFRRPEDLAPLERLVKKRVGGGQKLWDRMLDSLREYPGEN